MERYYSQAVGTPVVTLAGTPIGRIEEIVIDPETGKIAGFLLGRRGEYVIATADVLFWDAQIFIQDEDDILETHEILKIGEILKKNIRIITNKVFTKNGIFLGRVYDIALDPKLFVLKKLAVAKNILGLFPYREKIIPHSHILEIKPDCIIVKDLEEKVAVTAEKKLQVEISTAAPASSSAPATQ